MYYRKQILFILLILFVIVSSGCTTINDNTDLIDTFFLENTYITGLIPQCESGLVDKDLCYLDIAIQTKNVSYCFNVGSVNLILECITRYAIKTKNPNICTTSYRVTDSSRVNKFTNDYRYKCYYHYALETDDKSICEFIEPQNEEAKLLKKYCLAIFDKNIDACSSLEVDYYISNKYDKIQGDCLIEVAIRTKDAKLCEYALLLENGPYGVYLDRRMDGVFISDCYSKVAEAVGDKGLCENAITYPYKYIPCVGTFIQPEEVTDFCNTYTPDYILSYNMDTQCVKDLVLGKDNHFCDNIIDKSDKIQCFDTVCSEPYTDCKSKYKLLLDETLCVQTTKYDLNTKSEDYGHIWSGYAGGACIADIAQKTNNPVLCETITNEAYRNKCYVDYAYMTKDSKYCISLTITDAKSDCYTPFAIYDMDETYCQKIGVDTSLIQPCLDRIASIRGSEINSKTESV
ncbi:MAG: hypothetical protein K0B02_04180 [DPANN group archaeon]|nr:hypothetical protein [DPANN group archaeon]